MGLQASLLKRIAKIPSKEGPLWAPVRGVKGLLETWVKYPVTTAIVPGTVLGASGYAGYRLGKKMDEWSMHVPEETPEWFDTLDPEQRSQLLERVRRRMEENY